MSLQVSILILACLSIPLVTSVTIPSDWIVYIEQLISESSWTCAVITPPPVASIVAKMNSKALGECTSGATIALPHVILWEPMTQFTPYFYHGLNCPENSCGEPLSLFRWNTGSSKGHCPRLLHDVQHITLLVAAVYQCGKGHEILSTDPQILVQFVEQEHIPFILFHRSGITRTFGRSVIQLALEGLGFVAVERFVVNQRLVYRASLKLQISNILCSLEGRIPDLHSSVDNILSYIEKPYPSNDLICRCFLQDFLEHKHYYFHEMSLLTTSSYISMDHTFKVAANLGYVRPDGRWVTQYEAALIVLNDKGQVIAWQLTKTTSLDEVLPMLTTLSERLAKHQANPRIICVDNCCQLRKKLQAIFGNDTFVCLDIFHAVQRIIKCMPKRHPLYSYCKKDISMIFRNPLDRGTRRQMSTPDQSILLENVQEFIKKWKGAEMNDWHIWNNNVSNALDHLRIHISEGCLSEIPPGCGTNKNENLHKNINPFFSRCRIGVPLALALLTVLFHRHNQKDLKQQLPILHARAELPKTGEPANEDIQFGIVDDGSSDRSNSWIFGPRIKSIPDAHNVSIEGNAMCVELHLPSDLDEHVTISDVNTVLLKAITMLQIIQQMDKSSIQTMVKMAPFMSAVVSNFNTDQVQTYDECEKHKKRLHNLVQSRGYKLCDISPDGNCCFSAIAFGLLTEKSSIISELPSFFDEKQLPMQCNLKDLARVLRRRAVEEWQLHPHRYQGFLTNCNIAEEAQKFLQDGFYHGELANTMVLTLSNMLEIPIVVFSSAMHHPILFITPEVLKVSVPIYVGFTQYGPGHYNGICAADDTLSTSRPNIPSTEDTLSTSRPNIPSTEDSNLLPIAGAAANSKCCCGCKDKQSTQEHCLTIKTKYSSTVRCPCVRSERKCTEACKCNNCKNPFGERQPSDRKRARKNRERHGWQKIYPKSAIFAADTNKDLFQGPRTPLEYLVIGEILKFCLHNGLGCEEDMIVAFYTVVVDYAEAMNIILPLGHKTIEDINKINREYHHNMEVYKTLSITQLKIDILK